MNFTELGLKVSDIWPFGKHKGVKISLLPTNYLVWVVYDSDLKDNWKKKCHYELEKRDEVITPQDETYIKDAFDELMHRSSRFDPDIGEW